ncbi:MAG: hypothetical protein J5675_02950 [Bacteroidales bacterium]|nr:hypothetical protein [Bacteroidales bacterium]
MKRLLSIIAVVLAAVSCREPMSVEEFIAGEGPYRFSVDMTDSSAVYDFDFYTRVDARHSECPPEVLLMVRWLSPVDSVMQENVYLPIHSGQVFQPYRADMVPSVYGVWKLEVSCPYAALVPGFRGLGLITKKRHGTR